MLAYSLILDEISISVAPPPGKSFGSVYKFLETPRQSCRFLYISFKTSLDAPLSKIEQAVGFLHSTKYEKY